jgi:hypothetical protein
MRPPYLGKAVTGVNKQTEHGGLGAKKVIQQGKNSARKDFPNKRFSRKQRASET